MGFSLADSISLFSLIQTIIIATSLSACRQRESQQTGEADDSIPRVARSIIRIGRIETRRLIIQSRASGALLPGIRVYIRANRPVVVITTIRR